jgi:DNA-binding CsgD family transcriptional regulator
MPDRDVSPGPSAEADGPFFVSDRQREVLGLAALGCTDREIALQLTITVYTVRAHLRAIRECLGARNTCHAVVLALLAGLIEVDAFSAIEPV